MDEPKDNNQLTKTAYGQVRQTPIVQEMERSYLDYAMSVIVSRALPDVRDGLKPVHRRILFAMKGLGLTKNASYKKTARIVGEVLGKYHPHGDMAVYDALVRLAQDFSMRYPLIDGQGNFGSIDGDSPAAMRYTEARMEKISGELLSDLEKNTVDFVDNFDGTQQEPSVLPAKLPNLLLMGSDGIAVGMATKIPPHNLNEICDALEILIQKGTSELGGVARSGEPHRAPGALNAVKGKPSDGAASRQDPSFLESADPKVLIGEFTSNATLADLLEHVKGPDFPTGGVIYDAKTIAEVYATGRGSIVVRGVASIEENKVGRHQIIITQLPYQVNKSRLVAKIADLVKQKRLDGIVDLRDESDREGLRVAIDLRRDAIPKSVLNRLYKFTELQTSFPANIVALTSTGVPQLMNLKTILTEFTVHRQIVVVRRSQFELKQARERAHILEGLLKALDHLDEVIATIRKSKDSDDAKVNLMNKFGFTDPQAVAILDMQLRKLAALERQKLMDEYAQLKDLMTYLIGLLQNPEKMLEVITNELKYLKETYGDERRTKVVKGKVGEFSDLDLIPDENMIVTITKTGYIKRLSTNSYRSQRRGGKGVKGMETKEEDAIDTILTASTHDDIFFFTNKGKVYKLKVYELPEGGRLAKGQAIVNLLQLSQDEQIQSTLSLKTSNAPKDQKGCIVVATKRGLVKKTPLTEYINIKSSGLIAVDLKDNDELQSVMTARGDDHILLVTKDGKAIRFSEKDVRPTGRDTQGVRGLVMKKDDELVTMATLPSAIETPDDKRKKFFLELLLVTMRGIGKRTPVSEYPLQKRGGQGVKVGNINPKTGQVAAALLVTQEKEFVVITTEQAQVIKLPLKNIPPLKRATQGVILVRLDKADSVAAVTTIEKEE